MYARYCVLSRKSRRSSLRNAVTERQPTVVALKLSEHECELAVALGQLDSGQRNLSRETLAGRGTLVQIAGHVVPHADLLAGEPFVPTRVKTGGKGLDVAIATQQHLVAVLNNLVGDDEVPIRAW